LASVSVARVNPLSKLLTVTETSGTMPPEASLTTPVRDAVTCAQAGPAANDTKTIARRYFLQFVN
jgi:hypothetical protein